MLKFVHLTRMFYTFLHSLAVYTQAEPLSVLRLLLTALVYNTCRSVN